MASISDCIASLRKWEKLIAPNTLKIVADSQEVVSEIVTGVFMWQKGEE